MNKYKFTIPVSKRNLRSFAHIYFYKCQISFDVQLQVTDDWVTCSEAEDTPIKTETSADRNAISDLEKPTSRKRKASGI